MREAFSESSRSSRLCGSVEFAGGRDRLITVWCRMNDGAKNVVDVEFSSSSG